MLENKDNVKVVSIKPAVIKTPIWNKSVKKAQNNFENLNEIAKRKYAKELSSLSKSAEKNNIQGLEPSIVVDTILKVINSKNPKPSYNVGFSSICSDFVSRLPQSFVNQIVKFKLSKIK